MSNWGELPDEVLQRIFEVLLGDPRSLPSFFAMTYVIRPSQRESSREIVKKMWTREFYNEKRRILKQEKLNALMIPYNNVWFFVENVEFLKWLALKRKRCLGFLDLRSSVQDSILLLAAQRGNLPVLVWAMEERMGQLLDPDLDDSRDCPALRATMGNQFGVLEWLLANGILKYSGDSPCVRAAESGNVDMMRWWIETAGHRPTDQEIFVTAALHGRLEIIRYLHPNVMKADSSKSQMVLIARKHNHQHILEFLENV